MSKIIKKKNCKYTDGFIVDKKTDEIIGVPSCVVRELNKLEAMKQKTTWLINIPEIPAVEEFRFESEHDGYKHPMLEPDPEATPLLTKMAEETKQVMDERETLHIIDEINRELERFADAFEWVARKKFTEESMFGNARFDLKTIGNPLKLDEGDLLGIITDYVYAQHGQFHKED